MSTENSGGSVDYYKVAIEIPWTADEPYVAECGDIIDALQMNQAEANIFKEIWRTSAERTLGKSKQGNSPLRAAEKIAFFADKNLKRVTHYS